MSHFLFLMNPFLQVAAKYSPFTRYLDGTRNNNNVKLFLKPIHCNSIAIFFDTLTITNFIYTLLVNVSG